MCIVAVMSHGDEKTIVTKDGQSLDIEADLLERFNTANCTHLEGKPKWFIIQACRFACGLTTVIEGCID